MITGRSDCHAITDTNWVHNPLSMQSVCTPQCMCIGILTVLVNVFTEGVWFIALLVAWNYMETPCSLYISVRYILFSENAAVAEISMPLPLSEL